jgi:dipeptidase
MCTTMIFTKGATAHGAMVVTHSDDDELSDQRVICVPQADHPEGAMRPILPESYNFPRLVRPDRGPMYNTPGYDETKPIGEIPQAPHTYAYYDGNYGIVNEHGLMMGECTNGARYQPGFVTAEQAQKDGKHIRLMYSSELSRIALERCKTAREAVQLMGSLIDEWGYYSGGETLLVADLEEAWVFEMCALPDEVHHSAWIAQRVPDGEMFVAANTFRIRDVTGSNPDQMHSDHLLADLTAVGYWDPRKTPVCDWLPAISAGEYNHPYYSLRRIWRIQDRVNPDLGLSPWVEGTYTRNYPFSIRPNRKLTRQEIFDLYRDHYEGTEFDLTKGIAAGPYGDPNRFVGPYDGLQNSAGDGQNRKAGAWERAISVFYQGYSYVLENKPGSNAGAVMWFAPDVSYTSVFTPFWAAAAALPESFQAGNPRVYDPKTAWWIFDFLGNWARLNWKRMTQVDIQPAQKELERQSARMVEETEATLAAQADLRAVVSRKAEENAAHILRKWTELTHLLVAKYSDGYINPLAHDRSNPTDIGYPAHWLAATNYADGPTGYEMPVARRR